MFTWVFFLTVRLGRDKFKVKDLPLRYMAEDNQFKLTRSEFANKQGITVDNLKKRMKRGFYQNSYIFHNGKYLFSTQEAVRPIMGKSPGTSVPRKRNRGNHFKGKYPNLAFQQKNELRMLAKLKHNIDPEVQDLLPEAVELAKLQRASRLQSALNEPIKKNYGSGLIDLSNSGYGSKAYSSPTAHKLFPNKFKANNRGPSKPKKGPYEI